MRPSTLSEAQLEIARVGEGIFVVCRNLAEAESAIERDRLGHAVERIEPDRAIARITRGIHRGDRESAAEAATTRGRRHVEALHLGDAVSERPHADDARAPPEKQGSRGWRVL